MFVPQSRSSRHSIHCERAAPKDVESQSAESCQAKKACQRGQVFEYGKLAEELTVFTDSDWAGCKETLKSSSASVLMLGIHTLKAHTRKQKVIAKSSTEAELHAAALGASEAKGVQSVMCDLGFAVKPVLAIDAEATRFAVLVYRMRSDPRDCECAESGAKMIAKHCLTLGYMNMDEKMFPADGKWWRCSGTLVQQSRPPKVQSCRAHASSSTETSSQSAPNVSAARNSRQIFTEHHEV